MWILRPRRGARIVAPPPALPLDRNSVQSTLTRRPATRRQSFLALDVNTTTSAPRCRTILHTVSLPDRQRRLRAGRHRDGEQGGDE